MERRGEFFSPRVCVSPCLRVSSSERFCENSAKLLSQVIREYMTLADRSRRQPGIGVEIADGSNLYYILERLTAEASSHSRRQCDEED